MQIRLNGADHELPQGATVEVLLQGLGLRPELVAVERNRGLVPRESHGSTELAEGDQLEIVTLVGGG